MKDWIGKILNNPVLSKVLSVAGVVLGTYSAFTGSQTYYNNPNAKGLTNLGLNAFGLATSVNAALAAFGFINAGFVGMMTNPAGWVATAGVLAASYAYAGINDWVTNGFSWGAFGTTLSSSLGVGAAAGMTASLLLGVSFAAATVIGLAVMAAVVLFSYFWSLMHQPDDWEISAGNLTKSLNPSIWTAGPLALVAAGTVAALMGWNKNQSPPVMSSLTVPSYYVTNVLTHTQHISVTLPKEGGAPSVLVEQGEDGGPGKVVIVSANGKDANGYQQVKLQTYELSKNLQFVSSPKAPPYGTYIPFFNYVNGKVDTNPNPDLVNAVTSQDKLLQSILSGYLSTQDALSAMQLASAANKAGVNPVD